MLPRRRDVTLHRRLLPFAVGVVVCVAALASAAKPPHTFDIVTYTPPDGFAIDESQKDHVLISKMAAKTYCMIGIYESTPASADLDASFAAEWSNLVIHTIDPVDAPKPSHADVGKAHAAVGSATSTVSGHPVFGQLTTIDAGTRVVSILVLAPNAAEFTVCAPQITTLLKSVVVKRVDAGATVPEPAAGSGSAPGSEAPAIDNLPAPAHPLSLDDVVGDWKRGVDATAHLAEIKAGTFTGFDAMLANQKWSINAKGVVDTEFRGANATGSKPVLEKHTALFSITDDGEISIQFKRGEGTEEHYLIRGWLVTHDLTVLQVDGPYGKGGIPDDARKHPSDVTNEYWLRKNPAKSN